MRDEAGGLLDSVELTANSNGTCSFGWPTVLVDHLFVQSRCRNLLILIHKVGFTTLVPWSTLASASILDSDSAFAIIIDSLALGGCSWIGLGSPGVEECRVLLSSCIVAFS